MVDVTLETVANGVLPLEFANALPKMVEALKATGKAASVTMKVTLKPMKNMNTTYTTHATTRMSLPVVEYGALAQMVEGRLVTDPPIFSLEDSERHQITIDEAITQIERGN
jgi:hypothetical protein